MRKVIFDPIPRVDGIASASDSLTQVHSDIYLLSCPPFLGNNSEKCLLRFHRPLDQTLVNHLRQQGHSPTNPFTSDIKAVGCGSVMIALNANGARWA